MSASARSVTTFGEYQREVARTAAPTPNLAVLGLGVAGEAGEVAELLKKHLGHGKELDPEKLAKELGDVLWYVAALGACVGLELEDIAQRNVAKLRARYPDGFSVEASSARADERPGSAR